MLALSRHACRLRSARHARLASSHLGAHGSLAGVWKVNLTPRVPGAREGMPKRLRLLEGDSDEAGGIEVPYMDCTAGGWAVTETDDPAAVDGNRRVVIDVTLATPPHSFRFDGLFDGERIAGSVSASEAQGGESGEATVLGDFLCTRLFTFWGSPKPRAIDVT
mmetsp:Transcript_32535/g.106449  ORF Transcript_32535/g.106449 Transcript_32535/m.106449 type:complete len:163 (+) Transcript_32535:3-491(+)